MAGYDFQIKLLMIGDSGVGKTSLLARFSNDTYSPDVISTIGVDFKIKTMHLVGKFVKLQIWDTAGHERFRSITTSYYRGAQGILLVYDISRRETFGSIRSWVEQIQQNADAQVDMILLGNKSDHPKRAVTSDEGRALAKGYNIPFYETSAANASNVEKAYIEIATTVAKRVLPDETASRNSLVRLKRNNGTTNDARKTSCC